MDSYPRTSPRYFSTARRSGLHGRHHDKQAAERNEEKDDKHNRTTKINEARLWMLYEYVRREG